MKQSKFFALTLFTLLITACGEKTGDNQSDADYLVFGHFYGFCQGENCIEIFKLENNQLLEDSNDKYPGQTEFYQGSFSALESSKFEIAKNLMDYFPKDLLNESEIRLGCPDCADQGGLYIEYNFNGVHKFWLIDQSKGSVPDYLHDFMDKVNEKIALINN